VRKEEGREGREAKECREERGKELLLKRKRKEGKEEGGNVGRASFACLDRLTKCLSHTHILHMPTYTYSIGMGDAIE